MNATNLRLIVSMLVISVFVVGFLGQTASAQEEMQTLEQKQKKAENDRGFKIGKLRLHPGLSLQNVFDSNVNNASDKNDTNYSGLVNYDDILHIIGAFKLNYPSDIVAFTLDGEARYVRYFGIDNSTTKDLSAPSGNVRVALNLFRKAVAGFEVSDTFTRSIEPKKVGIVDTNDRMHNQLSAKLNIRPGGGQLRFTLGYTHDLERYDSKKDAAGVNIYANQNWMEHNFLLNWEWEFFPKTALFMSNSFGIRDYYDFNVTNDNGNTNSSEPSAMPLRILLGVMGRVTNKFLINVAAGYGNSFSSGRQEDYNNFLGRLELVGQFTPRTQLKGGYARSFNPVTTFSYQVDNKIYMEFKQWFVNDSLKLSLYGYFSIFEFGRTDSGIDDQGTPYGVDTDEAANQFLALGNRDIEFEASVTPSMRYDFLSWIYMEIGYTFTWRDSDFVYRIIDSSAAANQQVQQVTYYDYLKHEAFLKLTLAY